MNALQTLIEELREPATASIRLSINERIHIADNNTALHLFRIAQEALNNAVKHAGANHIEVSLGSEAGRGYLKIRDDGRGIDAGDRAASGLGLRIMSHRCSLIDAELNIESSPGRGTLVSCYFSIETGHDRT